MTANLQALWAVNDEAMTEMTLPFLDEELAGLAVPVRVAGPGRGPARDGQRLAGAARPDPMAALHVAVNRVDPDEPGDAVPARGGARAWSRRGRRTPAARRT